MFCSIKIKSVIETSIDTLAITAPYMCDLQDVMPRHLSPGTSQALYLLSGLFWG